MEFFVPEKAFRRPGTKVKANQLELRNKVASDKLTYKLTLFSTPFSLLASIDVTKLTTIGQFIWLVLLKFAVADQIGENLSLPVRVDSSPGKRVQECL